MGQEKKQYNINEILQLLPHRYPFVLVDRIINLDVDDKILGLKNVTINEHYFTGHFPSEPVMPGVLVLEGLAQAGCILAYVSEPEMIGNKLAYFTGLDKVKFRKKVVPGDQLIYEVRALKRKLKLWILEGKAKVDGQVVAEAQIKATFI